MATADKRLHSACLSGNFQRVLDLLEEGADANAILQDWSPLLIAAFGGHVEIVVELLRAGAAVDLAASDRATPLIVAAQNGHTGVAAELLRAGASVDWAKRDGATPLIAASHHGHSGLVEVLLEGGACVDLAANKGTTPLIAAAQNGHADVAAELLRAGAGVDLVRSNGATPLIVAAQNGHTSVVQVLLEGGACVDLAANDGTTPLIVAAGNGHSDVAAEFLRAGASVDLAMHDGATPLFVAAQSGHTDVVQTLLDGGASVDLGRDDGWTPLIIAALNRRASVVKSLLSAGANANLADDRGRTPLALALEHGRTAMQNTLVSAGALVNGRTRTGEPSVVAAVQSGALSVLTACLDGDDTPDSGAMQRALWWAVACGRAQFVHTLLNAKYPCGAFDAELPTLTCLAAHQADLDVLQTLVEHEPSCIHAAVSVTGYTAVDYAIAVGHNDVAEWLYARGAVRAVVTEATDSASSGSTFDSSVTISMDDATSTVRRTQNIGFTTAASSVPLSTSAPVVGETHQSGSGESMIAEPAIEEMISRLHSHSDGFVFAHILPTGKIGMGAFGEVSRGIYFGRHVAFKLQRDIDAASVSAGDISQLRAFAHEARMLAVVAEPSHRHCAGFLGVAVSPDVGIALVTEYVSGGDLRSWLQSNGPFGVADGLEFLAGLASGLAFLHEAGVVHGDIKPENILLEFKEDDSGRVHGKWIDLGGGYPYWRGRTAYTPRYASPEQLCGELTHAGSDVFSFACVMLEVLSGERPDYPRHAAGPPLQHNLTATSVDGAVDEARETLPNVVRQLLPNELTGCDTLATLLLDCWQARVYSRPRTSAVFETLMELLKSIDPERARMLTQQLEATAPPPSGNCDLMAAVQYCDVEEVRRLVGEGARADEQNRWGHTPLHVAAAVGDLVILKVLLTTTPELLEDSFGKTAIEISEEHAKSFRCGADVLRSLRSAFGFARDDAEGSSSSQIPLHDAVARQDFGAVTMLLRGGAHVNSPNGYGETALHVAARLKASQLVSLLIEHGADVNAIENVRGNSPLHLAADVGGLAEVVSLLKANAGVDTMDTAGWTALMAAAEGGHCDVVTALLESSASVNQAKDNGSTALMLASQNGHCDVVTALLESGASVNQAMDDGWTALMSATRTGRCDVVAALLERGASVNQASDSGLTALMFASRNGHCDVVRVLLESGASVNQAKDDGWTALMIASQNGHCNVVTALLESGASVNHASDDGLTALVLASQNGHCVVVSDLLESGASVNHAKDDGSTALLFASQNGHCDVVTALLESGASVNQSEDDGWTALMFASMQGHCDVACILLNEGAEVTLRALGLARAGGHDEIAALLMPHIRFRLISQCTSGFLQQVGPLTSLMNDFPLKLLVGGLWMLVVTST